MCLEQEEPNQESYQRAYDIELGHPKLSYFQPVVPVNMCRIEFLYPEIGISQKPCEILYDCAYQKAGEKNEKQVCIPAKYN